MSVDGKKVVVVGGGLGGLSFAINLERLCKKNNLSVFIEVLERDAKAEAKDFQNYSLSIRTDSGGVQALRETGVLDDVLTHCCAATEGFYVATHSDNEFDVLLQGPPMNVNNSGIRPLRYGLWTSLLRKAESGDVNISWSSPAKQVTRDPDTDKYHVTLENERTVEADLVVVSDGAQSAVRNLMHPDQQPSFTGLVLLCGSSNSDPPKKLLRKHGLVVGSDGVAMFVGHEDEGQMIWAVSTVESQPHAPHRVRTATEAQQKAILEEALDKIQPWPQEMKDIVSAVDLTTIRVVNGYDRYARRASGRVVFIGDANHPVTPFSANGANMALVDGLRLAQELTNSKHKRMEDAISAFDDAMLPRAKKIVDQGRNTISFAHTTGWKATARNFLFRFLGLIIAHPTFFKVVGVAVVAKSFCYFSGLQAPIVEGITTFAKNIASFFY